jgi:hypothetical protein
MISETRVEEAVEFLRDSAMDFGRARGHQIYAEKSLSRVKSLQMVGRPGSAADREASAYASAEYLDALEGLQNAVADCETLRAQRDAAEMLIEVWRSQFSASRRGNI